MKKFFSSKVFVGIVCFILGAVASHLYTQVEFHSQVLGEKERDERFPVKPEDFDHEKLMDAFSNFDKSMQSFENDFQKEMQVTGVERKEDDKFVYFEIPLNANEKNHELKVSVKDGMISIKENTPNSEAERQFSIDPDLDGNKADIQTLKDKVLIKIPKK